MTNDKSIKYTYEVLNARIDRCNAHINFYGDLVVSLTIETQEPMTKLEQIDPRCDIPFKTKGKNTYIASGFYALDNKDIMADVNFISINVLYLIVDKERRNICKKLSYYQEYMSEEDLYKQLNIPLTQKQPESKVEYELVKQTLDQISVIPVDVSSIIAEYYNPYPREFLIKKFEAKNQTQQYFVDTITRVVAIKYPKEANISISFHGIDMLGNLPTFTTDTSIIKTFGPCDSRLVGYDPEKKNIVYTTFKRTNEIDITSNCNATIEFICL